MPDDAQKKPPKPKEERSEISVSTARGERMLINVHVKPVILTPENLRAIQIWIEVAQL